MFEIEKADPIEGIIQLVAFKARPEGSDEGDRDGDGLDPVSAAKAFSGWVANYGTEIDYVNPQTQRVEKRYCGLYDSHKTPIAADLLGAWYFADELKARIIVRPHDRSYAEKAARGQIRGASWAGSVFAKDIAA